MATSGSAQDHGCCSCCHMMLHEPFIQCQQCSTLDENFETRMVNLCTGCFTRGKEFGDHKSNHSFAIVNNTFSIFESGWNASEEIQLLNNLLRFGHGNWDDIAKSMAAQKTADEIRNHFEQYYVDDVTGDFKDVRHRSDPEPNRRDEPFTHTTLPDVIKKSNPEIGAFFGARVLRPAPMGAAHKEVAGYNAARSDFDFEYDNGFEINMNSLETNSLMYGVLNEGLDTMRKFKDDPEEESKVLESALALNLLSIYKGKLKARQRRKRVVKEYGLLNKAKAMCLPSRYPHINAAGPKYDQIYKLGSKLMCSMKFDYVLEGLHHEMMLRQQILHLQEFRQSGLQRYAGIDIFMKMKAMRARQLRDLSMMNESIRDWAFAESNNKSLVSFYEDGSDPSRLIPTTLGSTRRSAAPLNIVGLPAYDKLTAGERDLCSEQRVLPEVFMEIKGMMLEECAKNGGLRLADVRPMVKIDVNKTKVIYQYFIKNELIFQPQD